MAVATGTYEYNGVTIQNSDFCFKPISGKGCLVTSAMQYWQTNLTRLLNDPDIKARVEAYFCENSTYSRDAVHVAAVACRFKKKKVFAGKQQRRETS